MTDEKTKAAILARRARFIAAAMMGAGMMGCDKKPTEPLVCLSPPALTTPPDTAPTVCLSVEPTPQGPPDAGAGIDDAGTVDAGKPRPCLGPRPCLKPRACLSMK